MKVPNTVLKSLYLLAAFFLFATPVLAQQDSKTPSLQEPPPQQETTRPWIGVTIQEVNERVARQMGIRDPRGVLVADVAEGSPAEEAGVNMGDVIVRLNGRDIEGASDFITRIQEAGVGSVVALEVNRAGATEEMNVTLEPMPPAMMTGRAQMGMGMGQGMGMMSMGGAGGPDCPMHARGMDKPCPMGHDCPMGAQCPDYGQMGAQYPGYGQMMGGKGMMRRHPGKSMMGMGGQMGMFGGPMYGKIMMAIKAMNLTPEQKAKADAIHSDFRKKAVRAAADVKVAHIELHELLAADPVNLDKVRAKVNELVQKKTDMMMLGIRSLEDFKKVLNPDQKKMLKDMLAMDSGEMDDMESGEALEGAE